MGKHGSPWFVAFLFQNVKILSVNRQCCNRNVTRLQIIIKHSFALVSSNNKFGQFGMSYHLTLRQCDEEYFYQDDLICNKFSSSKDYVVVCIV